MLALLIPAWATAVKPAHTIVVGTHLGPARRAAGCWAVPVPEATHAEADPSGRACRHGPACQRRDLAVSHQKLEQNMEHASVLVVFRVLVDVEVSEC
jgi:hypothetical protein